MQNHKDIERLVRDVEDLPPMPEITAGFLELVDDPTSDMAQISSFLEQDPALTAKVLRVTNSAYYGVRQSVGSLKLALAILGLREVRNIVLTLSLFDSLTNDRVESLLGQEFRVHSLVVAGMVTRLCSHMRLNFEGQEFISGLLHDIGKMVLSNRLGDKYVAIYQTRDEDETPLYVRERAQLGFSHADVGAALATRWAFPKTLRDAIRFHHPSDSASIEQAEAVSLCAIVRIANLASYDDFSCQDPSSCTACADSEAWEPLGQIPVPLAPESRFKILARLVEESKESAKALS